MARKNKQGGSSGSQQTGSSKRKTRSEKPAAKRDKNRPGPSGTGKKTGVKSSSSARRSGSRSGGDQGSKAKLKERDSKRS